MASTKLTGGDTDIGVFCLAQIGVHAGALLDCRHVQFSPIFPVMSQSGRTCASPCMATKKVKSSDL